MKLKVCGMKYKDNINEVAHLQPDYLGFIFYEKSSRFFKGVIPKLPNSIKKVGVFVDASLPYILEKIEIHKLQTVQLHGEESPEFCAELKLKCHTDRSPSANKDSSNEVPVSSVMIEIVKVFSQNSRGKILYYLAKTKKIRNTKNNF